MLENREKNKSLLKNYSHLYPRYSKDIFRKTLCPAVLLLPKDSRFIILDINNSYMELCEFQATDLIGEDFVWLLRKLEFDEEGINIIIRSLKKIMQNGNSPAVDPKIIVDTVNNLKKSCSVHHEPIIDDNNEVNFIIHSLKDLSSVKKEQTHQSSISEAIDIEQHYQALFNQNPDAVFSLNGEGNFVSANEKLTLLAETGLEELLKMNFRQFCDPDNLIEAEAYFENTWAGASPRFDLNVITAKNNRLILDVSLIPLKISGRTTGVYGIVKDITEKIIVREDLDKVSKDLKKIMEASVDVICAFDENGVFRQVSAAAGRVWGYDPDELLYHSYSEFVPEEDLQITKIIAAAKNAKPIHTSFESRNICKDGSVKPMIWTGNWDEKEKMMYCVAKDATEQKKAELKFKELFEVSPLPMWVYDTENFRFQDVNESAIRSYGYTMQEFLSMSVTDIHLPEDVNMLSQMLHDVRDKNSHNHSVVRHKKKCGEIIHVQIESNPFEFKGRKSRLVLGIDISAKLKAEYSLELSEQRFKSLVQNSSDMISVLDIKGNYTYLSPTCMDILGIPPEEFIGKNAFDFIHPDDVSKVSEQFGLLSNQKRLQIDPFRFVDTQGNFRWIETTLTNLLDNESVRGIVANSRDVTERTLAEVRTRKSEEKRTLIMNAALDAIICIDTLGFITFWNSQAETIFGWKEEEVLGLSLKQLIFPGKLFNIFGFDASNRIILDNVLSEETAYNKEGSALPIEIVILPINQEGDEFVCAIIRDITERKKATAFIEDQNARLKDIAWIQSHVVRAPVCRIMGLVDLLRNCRDVVDEQEVLNHIEQSAKELDYIIRDIVDKTQDLNLKSVPGIKIK